MSPRTGRPKTENPKQINLTIRLDPATANRLQEHCDKHHISKGEVVRQGIYLVLEQRK